MKNAIEYPTRLATKACLANFESARVVDKARAMFGESKGAITIDPIMTATSLYKIPIEATIEARTTSVI